MRVAICCISLIATTFAMVGCGQSGDLQLPGSPDYDKRPKYLLYKNVDQSTEVKQDVKQSVNAASSEAQASSEAN
ncbi:LPS translocon maturation chaperone LptM [Acinetobacter stercoris]|uniref:Lipoprotein n=1 Tax=Acinetobacter stercoris TaxID=2126983 RepID=A0A2U3N2K6_9GAMM|nr:MULTISPECIES: lipoprotein [Acinetobacter]SPL71779.1 hypothetical protein KPC_2957 [Acinetobacter stercoris]